MLDGETDDPFGKPYETDADYMPKEYSKERLHLPEADRGEEGQTTTYYRYEITVGQEDWMQLTPSIAASLLMSHAIGNLFPDDDRMIACNLASDMRKALNMENTFKNCAISLLLPFERKMSTLTFSEQADLYRQILNEQRNPENARRNANMIWGLGQKLETFDSFQDKKKIMSFFDGLFLDTYIISYIGNLNLGAFGEYYESVHLYNAGTTGLSVNIINAADVFTFDFMQSFPSDNYLSAFTSELNKYGINYQKTGCIPFSTPCDSIQKTARLNDERNKLYQPGTGDGKQVI